MLDAKPKWPGEGVGDEVDEDDTVEGAFGGASELESTSEPSSWGFVPVLSSTDCGVSTSELASPTSGRSRRGGMGALDGGSLSTRTADRGDEGTEEGRDGGSDLMAIADEEDRLCECDVGNVCPGIGDADLLSASFRWCSTSLRALRRASFSATASFSSSSVSASFIRSAATILLACQTRQPRTAMIRSPYEPLRTMLATMTPIQLQAAPWRPEQP